MNRFKKVLNVETVETTVQDSNSVVDPRPDLTEDSELWSRLLTLAKVETERLNNKTTVKQEQTGSFFGVLHGFRCAGTRLRRSETGSGMYVLRPDIDPTGERAWMNEAEYKQFCMRYLAPWEESLIKILKILSFGSK